MDSLLPVIAAMSLASLALLLYNTLRARLPSPTVSASHEDGKLRLWIEGRLLAGYIYKARCLPPDTRDPGRRITRIARDVGVSVTIISALYKVPRDKILSKLESAIGQLEASYAVTKSASIKKKLEAAERLLDVISGSETPYWGAMTLIIWAPEGPEGRAQAEAFRVLAEADLGLKLEPSGAHNATSLLAPNPHVYPVESGVPVVPVLQAEVDGYPVVLGWRAGSGSEIEVLSYPRDFEAHIGIVGPTGRGKTVLLAGLAAQLGMRSYIDGDPSLLVVDPKGDLTSLLSGVDIHEVYTGLTAEEYINIIEKRWENQRLRGKGRTVLIVDEAWRLMKLAPGLFEAIAREGRSLGFHLVYAVQEPSDIPAAVADNTASFIVFGGTTASYTAAASKLGLGGYERELLSLPVGEAILVRRDSRPLTVRLVNFTKLLKPAQRRGAGVG